MPTYSGFFTFGDSLVDAGNALELAEFYEDLTFSDLPDGAPSESRGYFDGRFSDGYVFTDLLANKLIGLVTKAVFPFGYDDPVFGIPISPFGGDPDGNNLNFAYGGAQIRQGDEVVPDLDGQTDAFRNAVDGDADPNALYSITIGSNDIRSMVTTSGTLVGQADAYASLRTSAEKMLRELSQLMDDGALHFLITGIADVGLVARYDVNGDNFLGPDQDLNGDGILEAGEATRAATATDYSRYLDMLVRTLVIPGLEARGATVTCAPLMDYVDEQTGASVTGALTPNLETIALLNNVQPDDPGETPGQQLLENLLLYDRLLFVDGLHPTAQAHALVASFMNAQLQGTAWVETMPLLGADVDFQLFGTIAATGEVDQLVVATAVNSSYTVQMLGVSSLTPFVLGEYFGLTGIATGSILADPRLAVANASGAIIGSDDDSGAGLDSSLVFAGGVGTVTISSAAVGMLTGNYGLTISVSGGALVTGNTYTVSSASTLVIEGQGWLGKDVVLASVSYALNAGSEIEELRTANDRGKTAINLTGNEFDQAIVGNAGANIIDGRGGTDLLTGGAGNDTFLYTAASIADPLRFDTITDYSAGDVIDVRQLLSIGSGVDPLAGGFVRLTSTGLLQVDLDGGGDSWTSLAQLNSGSLTVRYLSGGASADVTLGTGASGGGGGGGKGRPAKFADTSYDAAASFDLRDAHGVQDWYLIA